MSDDLSVLKTLIQGMQFKDARLKQALELLVDKVSGIYLELHPLTIARLKDRAEEITPPNDPTTFSYILNKTSIRLYWNAIANVSNYEIRRGNTWETAERIVVTPSTIADISPISSGTTRYLLKGIGTNGLLSINALPLDIVVPNIGSTIITSKIIDNNVLLYWTIPTSSFEISYYIIKKDGVELSRVNGTFATIFENLAGSYLYSIIPYDIAGNSGPENSILCEVKQPPDYELQNNFISTFSGTKNNCILLGNKLLACVNTIETFQEHFINNGFSSTQDQLDNNYPFYIQPTLLNGYYEEIIDYGTPYNNTIINVNFVKEQLSGDIDVSIQLSISLDGITYVDLSPGSSGYASSVRYLKVRLTFTSLLDTNLIYVSGLNIRLDVKQEVDSGYVNAIATDVDGTEVTFNKSFKDVNSITLSVESIQPITAIYDFVDVPNPTSFKVFTFDSSGNRVSYLVSWKARGIV